MKYTYRTSGVCARAISFDVIDDKVYNIVFDGGCRGNTQGVAKLADGMEIDRVISLLRGTQCRNGTSCPDQLALALEAYKNGELE
jgi:uncharacterized protein (TIGR03905 family)